MAQSVLDVVDAMCNVVVIACFFNVKTLAWGGKPCSTAYSKAVAMLSQRFRNGRNAVATLSQRSRHLFDVVTRKQ